MIEICPHCSKSIHFEYSGKGIYPIRRSKKELEKELTSQQLIDALTERNRHGFEIGIGYCPACKGEIITYREGDIIDIYPSPERRTEKGLESEPNDKFLILHPEKRGRLLSNKIPDPYLSDFKEADKILDLSPRASAALSRRNLQNILREKYKIGPYSLSKEIDEFIKITGIPSDLANQVDAIRNVGNFAAHPNKDTNTGEILNVENGEAEWLLMILEELFDYAFIRPTRLDKKVQDLNAKLQRSGKKPINQPNKNI